MPDEMRAKLEAAAKDGGRSLHAEIIRRLEWALQVLGPPTSKPPVPDVSGDIPYAMSQDIAELAEIAGVSFDEMLSRIFVAGIHKDAPQILYLALMPGATTQELRRALEASKDIIRPDATIVSEMVKRKRAAMGPKPAKDRSD